jgi:hypothetical protein
MGGEGDEANGRRTETKGAIFMNPNLRTGSLSLAILFIVGALGACTTQAVDGGTGGTGPTTGSGGTTTGSGGGGGSGVVCNPNNGSFAPNAGIACPPPPPSGLISDFTVSADAGVPDGGLTQARFGDDSTTLSGGESTYANTPGTIASNVAGGDWHITGNVANYAGFSLYFDDILVNNMPCNMVDASAFTGISFTIWGSTAGNPITMAMGIVDDTPTPSWFMSVGATLSTMPTPAGSCIPNANGMQYYHPGCADPTAPAISIPASADSAANAKPVSFKWADFVNGACKPNVIPNQIVSVAWQFAWATGMAPYAVDIHIDNLTFTK